MKEKLPNPLMEPTFAQFQWYDTQTSFKGEIKFFPHYNSPIPPAHEIIFERVQLVIEDIDNFNRLKKSILWCLVNERRMAEIPATQMFNLPFAPRAAMGPLGFSFHGFHGGPGQTIRFQLVNIGKRRVRAKLVVNGIVHRPPKSWTGI